MFDLLDLFDVPSPRTRKGRIALGILLPIVVVAILWGISLLSSPSGATSVSSAAQFGQESVDGNGSASDASEVEDANDATTVPDTTPDTTVPDTTPDATTPDTTVPETTPDTTVPATDVPAPVVPDAPPVETPCVSPALSLGVPAQASGGLMLTSPGQGQEVEIGRSGNEVGWFLVEGAAPANTVRLYLWLNYTNSAIPSPADVASWSDETASLNADGTFSLGQFMIGQVGTRKVEVAAVLSSGETVRVEATVVGVAPTVCP
jgi:hypothetical protein